MLKEKINEHYETILKTDDEISKKILLLIKKDIENKEKESGIENLPDEEALEIVEGYFNYYRDTRSRLNKEHQHEQELALLGNFIPKRIDYIGIRREISSLVRGGVTDIKEIIKRLETLNVDENLITGIYQDIIEDGDDR